MTEIPQVPVPAPALRRRPFSSLRVDPKKRTDGIWIEHHESKDRLRVRRLWCPEHVRAYQVAVRDYEGKNGKGTAAAGEGKAFCDAVAMATGLIIDWELPGDGQRPYDAAEMAVALQEPEYIELRDWITVQAATRENFQADDVAGN